MDCLLGERPPERVDDAIGDSHFVLGEFEDNSALFAAASRTTKASATIFVEYFMNYHVVSWAAVGGRRFPRRGRDASRPTRDRMRAVSAS
jgi:hypothetical protein